jgi:hypothetical protein
MRSRTKVGAAVVAALKERDREAPEKDVRGVVVTGARAVKQAAIAGEDMSEIAIIMEVTADGDGTTTGNQEITMTRIERGPEIPAIAVEVPALVRIEAVFTAEPITTAIVITTRVILLIAAVRRRKARSVVAARKGIVNWTKRNNRAAADTANGTDLAKTRKVTQGGQLMRMESMEILIANIPMNVTHPSRLCNASNRCRVDHISGIWPTCTAAVARSSTVPCTSTSTPAPLTSSTSLHCYRASPYMNDIVKVEESTAPCTISLPLCCDYDKQI